MLEATERQGGVLARLLERFPALRALRHRDYRLYIGGQLVSLVGTWMQSVAQSWLVYRLTGSSVLLGLVGFAGQFPVFVLALLGGSVADRRDRHSIVVAMQAMSMGLAFALAGLTLGGLIQLWHVFALAVLGGVVAAFEVPARQALMADMVGRGDLSSAIALNSSTFNLARVLGPAVAGTLVSAVGEGWCFALNGVSFLAVLAGLLAMRRPRSRARRESGSALGHAAEGLTFVVKTGPIRMLMSMMGLASLLGMSYQVLMPVFADRILHGGADTLGLLTGASGVGALFGALFVAGRRGNPGMGGLIPVSALAFGLGLVAFSASTNLVLSLALLVPVGFAVMVELAAANSLIQAMVPDHLRGRVMAIYTMMLMGMAPFGSILSGLLSNWLGAAAAARLGGLACMAGAIVFAGRWPAHREEARALIRAQASSDAPGA